MASQGPGQFQDVVEDESGVTQSVDPARVVPVQAGLTNRPFPLDSDPVLKKGFE